MQITVPDKYLDGSTRLIECVSFEKSHRALSISHSRSIFITFCNASYNFSLENLERDQTKYIISLNFPSCHLFTWQYIAITKTN